MSEATGTQESVQTEVRKTVGQQALELRCKPDDKIEAIELQQEIDKGYFEEIAKVTQSDPCKHWIQPYFIVVLMTKPAWGINVMRRRFWGRQTLPRPVPSQTVYLYYPATGNLALLWTLPNLEAINWISHNRHNLPDDYKCMLPHVTAYLEKTLESKYLN